MVNQKKTIDTLVEDIYSIIDSGLPEDLDDGKILDLGNTIADVVRRELTDRQPRGTLRMSSIGQPCSRKLYYSVNNPEEAEPLPPSARLKFLFGHILEEIMLFLAEASGHTVEGRQDVQDIAGVKGHRDAVIDGVVVDVKSASTYSFKKFQDGTLEENDPFGYVTQLESYRHSSKDDPVVTDHTRAAFLVVDKTLGNVCLDIHKARGLPLEAIYEYKKKLVAEPEPPARGFDPVPEGKSGNMKLPTPCGYCDYKRKCHPALRTFLYSNGPSFLTHVAKVPNVPEAK